MVSPQTTSGFWKNMLIYHVPVILYACIVIAVSSIPNLKTPSVRFFAVDKLAHFVEYAIFGFLTFRSFSHLKGGIRVNLALLLSILFLSAFAVIDEYHQQFIPGRQADIADVATDLLGAVLVIVFLWLRHRRKGSPEG
jgi:VanZ family protein